MASITEYGWKHDGRAATFSQKGAREYTLAAWLRTDDKNADACWIRQNATWIPSIGAPYVHGLGSDLGAYCKQVQIQQRSAQQTVWDITVSYSSAIDDQQQTENPFEREPEVNYSFNPREIALQRAFDGPEGDQTGFAVVDDFGTQAPTGQPSYIPILNSADEIFEDPLTDYEIDLVITIERNERTFQPAFAHYYLNTINSSEWWGFQPRYARIHMITPTYTVEGNYKFWRVKYEIHVRTTEWIRKVLDVGFREKIVDGDTATFRPILDADGNHLQKPAKLDGEGRKLAEGSDPVWRDFYTYRRRDFNALNLRGPRTT